MQIIKQFDPSSASNGVIDVGAADAGSKMLLYNESPFNLNLDFYNGNQSILHAWEARAWTLDGDTKQVGWSTASSLNVIAAPISFVMGELYGALEKIEGTYPTGLFRQANIGNIGGVPTSSNNLTNEGNPLGTLIIDFGPPAGQMVSIWNDHFIWDVVQGGVGHQVLKGNTIGVPLQIGQAGDITQVLGKLAINQQITLPFGTLQGIAMFGPYTVTTTPTFFNHNLGTTPDICLLQITGTSIGAHGVEYDSSTMTGTQVKLTSTDAGGITVVGIALKF